LKQKGTNTHTNEDKLKERLMRTNHLKSMPLIAITKRKTLKRRGYYKKEGE
jgi:CRISPR/Cas system-associated protein Cas7 (RAMP superfamily)